MSEGTSNQEPRLQPTLTGKSNEFLQLQKPRYADIADRTLIDAYKSLIDSSRIEANLSNIGLTALTSLASERK